MAEIQKEVPLAAHTTFGIGGPAKYYSSVTDEKETKDVIDWAKNKGENILLLGGGSNLLISNLGFRGLVVHFASSPPVLAGNAIECFAGLPLRDLIDSAQKNGLGGMERMAGIPGSVGGAVRGNAGAFGTETKDAVETVEALDMTTGETRVFGAGECDFGYRESLFKRDSNWVVMKAVFRFERADGASIRQVMDETLEARNRKQRQDVKSAGSFFMNPVVSDESLLAEFERDVGVPARGGKVPAGWLIDRVEMRGMRVGGAVVSEQHSNYIVNVGGATAEDVVILMSTVKQRIRDTFGIELQSEVQMIGFDQVGD